MALDSRVNVARIEHLSTGLSTECVERIDDRRHALPIGVVKNTYKKWSRMCHTQSPDSLTLGGFPN
jgi:hypothetical protein